MNKVFLIGRLTSDPILKSTPSGLSVAQVSMATNKKWKDKDGELKEVAQFHNLVLWRGLADLISKYCKKGDKLSIVGELQTRSWEDQSGIKKYKTEIVVSELEFMGNNKSDEKKTNEEEPQEPVNNEEEEINIDDIPF